MFPKIFEIGGFFLPTYGVMVAAGFLLALWLTGKLATRAGLDPERVSNIAIYGALAGLLGAKVLMFVVDFDYYLARPREVFTFATLQAGGIFYGGLLGALGTGYYLLRKHALPIAATLDLYGPGLAIGQAIGRLGCFAAGCCWGDHCERPWAVTFTSTDAMQVTGVPLNVPMHPTQLYEVFTGLVVFAIVYRAILKPHAPGSIIGLYLVLSGLARFSVEFFRYHQQPNPFGGPLSTAQWISIGLGLTGAWLLMSSRRWAGCQARLISVLLVQKVSKRYSLYAAPADRLWEALPIAGGNRHTDFWALRDVTLKVPKGQFVAICGPNGSGKSTLLQITAGILQPTSGRVVTEGRIAALLELGAGFNPEFTGRENVFLNSEILGIGREEMERNFPSVAAFAEIGDFMDRPVKEYSSGMYVRLAFSTAIHVDPEILIVDEALSVGDAMFGARCVRKFEELKDRGVTVLFVSHDLGLVKRLADRAVLMMNGRVEDDGAPNRVVNHYVGLVHEWQNRQIGLPAVARAGDEKGFRHGDRTSRIERVELLDEHGEARTAFTVGESMTIRLRARFDRPCTGPMVGVLIRNRLGIDVFGTNTRAEGRQLGEFEAGDWIEASFTIPCLLTQQEYTLTVAVQHGDGASQDWLDEALSFAVVEDRATAGIASLPVRLEVVHGKAC